MTLKLYYDLLSPPSRGILLFLQAAKIPFEKHPIALRKGEHLSDEFKNNVSRFQKVPVIHDNGFILTESVAIVRYLVRERSVSDRWYSRDSKKQARIDEFLEWEHNNTRLLAGLLFYTKWLQPVVSGSPANSKAVAQCEERLSNCLDSMDDLWLNNSKYLAGDEITVADLFCASDLEQSRVAGYDPLKDRPILAAWLERVRKEMSPHYEEVHVIVNKLAPRFDEIIKQSTSKI